MADPHEIHTNLGIKADFIQANISSLPEMLTLPPYSSWSQVIEQQNGICRFAIVNATTGEEESQFHGASTYLHIPGKNDLLDIYFVLGTHLERDADAFYSGRHNYMMIQEPTWRRIADGSLAKFQAEIDAWQGTSKWIDLLKQQSNGTLEAYLVFSFQTVLLHEIAHRLHYTLDPEIQVDLHSRFILAAEQEVGFRQAINDFIRALYHQNIYYNSHREQAKNPLVRYEDAYWRTTGIYDPRVFSFTKDGMATKVAVASLITEALAYSSGNVLLDAMLQHQQPQAKELKALMTNAPPDGLPDRVIASRRLYQAITKSSVFSLENLSQVFPGLVVMEVINGIDTQRNTAWYLSEKAKDIAEEEKWQGSHLRV